MKRINLGEQLQTTWDLAEVVLVPLLVLAVGFASETSSGLGISALNSKRNEAACRHRCRRCCCERHDWRCCFFPRNFSD